VNLHKFFLNYRGKISPIFNIGKRRLSKKT
jgi:hypothetical protein